MTTPHGQPVNVAGEGSQVGVQALHAYIDTVTLPGDVQLTIGQEAPPQTRYQVGVENLKSRNPVVARKLIWSAMMSGHVNNQVLFHWLVAMLSGRTVRQFSAEEIDQLKNSKSRYAESEGDAWADGVRLIYRLLDAVLPSLASDSGPKLAKADMSFLVKQFDRLGEKQRDMVRPHLELFLTGPLQEEMWQRELSIAQSRQHSGGRLGRAWMFFQPVPAKVLLPMPRPESISASSRLAMRASACLFVAAAGYLGWELLRHGAFFGLLSYVGVLAGAAVAARADLEWHFLTERRMQKNEQFRAQSRSSPRTPGDELADGVHELFNRYFRKYALDKAERQRWEAATAGYRNFHAEEIIEVCRCSQTRANEVAWLIRYEVRQLRQRWQNGTLDEYKRALVPRPATLATRRAELAVVFVGSVWVILTLGADALADGAILLSAFWAWRWWRCWLHVNLERRRYSADRDEYAQRQSAIDEEFRRWSKRLEARPEDADMAAWLGCDRTVLLGRVLDHFQLPRSGLIAHAFLEQPTVAARRARIEGGLWRYAGYRLIVFLLAQDGVRQVKADLGFTTGTLTERERTSYRYDAIVSVRVLREARRGQTFEVRLTAGDPITVRVQEADPRETRQDQNAEPTEEAPDTPEAEEQTALDATSVADLLHMLEKVVGEEQSWFSKRDQAGAWSSDDGADSEEASG